MDPTCALFTPNDLAKSGMVGAMIPKPTATKNEAKTSTPTSRGNSAKGLLNLFWDLFSNCCPNAIH
jgi:hypothetical protein